MNNWLNWDEINDLSKDKEIVFWGYSLPRIEKACKYLKSGIAYIVDVNHYAQQRPEVSSPTRLFEDMPHQGFVIITTTGFTDVVTELEAHGLVAGKHFCVTPTLRDFEVLSRIKNHPQTIYFTCPDPVVVRGGLYRLYMPSGVVELLLEGHCHGIVQGKENIYLVDDAVGGVRVLNEPFEPVRTFPLPEGSHPHGIAYSEERDWIAVAFSGCDTIGLYTAKGKYLTEIPVGHRSAGLAEHHVNDLCIWKDRLYVTMFSGSGNWKREIYDGVLLEYDLSAPSRPPVTMVSDLWLPHTPVVIKETLHFCESMEGRVWAGDRRLITEFNGFVRGIAHDGHFYYIGQSQHRFITRRKGAKNISLDTGIFLVDEESKATKFFPTPGLMDINSLMVLT